MRPAQIFEQKTGHGLTESISSYVHLLIISPDQVDALRFRFITPPRQIRITVDFNASTASKPPTSAFQQTSNSTHCKRQKNGTMAGPTNSDTELLTEHFGYPPVVSSLSTERPTLCRARLNHGESHQALIDDIINAVNQIAEKALNSIEYALLQAPPELLGFRAPVKTNGSSGDGDADDSVAAAARLEIEHGTHQLETLLCSSIDRNFDKLELYVLRNILCVRPEDRDWMRLGHYEGLEFGDDADDSAANKNTVESVNLLRRQLQASQRLGALLQAEHARNEALLSRVAALTGPLDAATSTGASRSSLSDSAVPTTSSTVPSSQQQSTQTTAPPFDFLRRTATLGARSDATAPLSTSAAFAQSQLAALRALSTALRAQLPELRALESPQRSHTTGGNDGDNDEWRRERNLYVEQQTRRILSSAGSGGKAVELGPDGAVRDGEWQGPGRALAKGEVEALEQIVAGGALHSSGPRSGSACPDVKDGGSGGGGSGGGASAENEKKKGQSTGGRRRSRSRGGSSSKNAGGGEMDPS